MTKSWKPSGPIFEIITEPLPFGTRMVLWDGITYIWVEVGESSYSTLQTYYPHSGPGWDYRFWLSEPIAYEHTRDPRTMAEICYGFRLTREGEDAIAGGHANLLPNLPIGEWVREKS